MWEESNLAFTNFAQPGDVVDDEIVDYFLNILPPRTWKHNMMIQVGEAHDFVRGLPTYLTFVRKWDDATPKWVYAGCCHANNDVHAVEFTESEQKLLKLIDKAVTCLKFNDHHTTADELSDSLRRFRMQKL